MTRTEPSEMVSLEGGTFLMGADGPECVPADREGPVREVEVGALSVDPCAVLEPPLRCAGTARA
jgi:formylglycine-generating enzyme required for sulfatase activity